MLRQVKSQTPRWAHVGMFEAHFDLIISVVQYKLEVLSGPKIHGRIGKRNKNRDVELRNANADPSWVRTFSGN